MTPQVAPLTWTLTVVGIVGLLVFDLVFHVRKAHVPTTREAAGWTAVYVSFALLFGIGTVRNGAGVQFFVDAGTIEQVTATGADGGITWLLTYVPVEDGATIVAA